jgi:hypothetical protein
VKRDVKSKSVENTQLVVTIDADFVQRRLFGVWVHIKMRRSIAVVKFMPLSQRNER